MGRYPAAWLAPLLIGLCLWLPAGRAQAPGPPPAPAPVGGAPPAAAQPAEGGGPGVLALAVTAVFSLVILLIVCMPSRKH